MSASQIALVVFAALCLNAQSGNVLIPRIGCPRRLKSSSETETLSTFMTRPVRIISGIRIFEAAKTMALGGVATGSIKAYEQARTRRKRHIIRTIAKKLIHQICFFLSLRK